jgi:glycosyltransferase involved in cell wall biosynthesis
MSPLEHPTAGLRAMSPDDPPFIVFSEDWGEHPSSCQHLFRRIAVNHPVLWVNTIGMRSPTLSMTDFHKARIKLGKMLRGTREAQSRDLPQRLRLHVSQPPMLPFASIRIVREWNRRSVIRRVREAARSLGMKSPVIVSAVPNACDFVNALDRRRVVYYCVDDFTQWPGLDHALVRELDQLMIDASDSLIATSLKLERRLRESGKPTWLLQHGVDIDLFGEVAPAEHSCLAAIPRPRAGYLGLFDERNDIELIAALARRMSDVSFVFTGPVTADVSQLAAFRNVFLTGPVPYRELPQVIRGLDALFIPYLVNSFTDSISPLKFREYLATGKAVVTTPLAEALLQKEHIEIARTVDEWERALRTGFGVDVAARKARLASVLQGESWDDKAKQFLAMCLTPTPTGQAKGVA